MQGKLVFLCAFLLPIVLPAAAWSDGQPPYSAPPEEAPVSSSGYPPQTNATAIESESQSASDLPTLTSTVIESTLSATSSYSVSSSNELPTTSVLDPNSTSAPSSSPTPIPPSDPEIAVMYERRLSALIGAITNARQVEAWLSTLAPNGKWPDSEINYTTGCEAQRANWPAQAHWSRIVTMAATWHGGVANGSQEYVKNEALREAISRAADYWFSRDFTGNECLDRGGTLSCPCENPNNWLWNTNWFSNIILIPEYVGQTCLILGDTLEPSQYAKCIEMTARSYQKFYEPINGVSAGLTGANAIDVARIGMDNALLTGNVTLLEDAYRRVQVELVIQNEVRADGIRADGAFAQHDGILYNGNYGKDFSNGLLDFEIVAAGTRFGASPEQQSAFGTLFDGNKWMIIYNTVARVFRWDFSAIGRFLVFPVTDFQATRDLRMNLTKVGELGQLWGNEALSNFATGTTQPSNSPNGNQVLGTKMFFTNDLMVRRTQTYVTSLKLWSSRTKHTECTNSANPFGFHLADGVQYTYIRGDEYENVPGAWDWDLIPGITTDYGVTPLICNNTRLVGAEAFVGGVTDGIRGLAVMRYTNPVTRSLRWQKAWFFLDDDVEHILVANITSINTSAPVYSVLDQRRLFGTVQIDDEVITQPTNRTQFRSLWHGDVGYTFEDTNSTSFALNVQFGVRQGNWTAIGTSSAPPFTTELFSAWIHHQNLAAPLAYSVYPAVSPDQFREKSSQAAIRTLQNDGDISAVYDEKNQVFMAVFWNKNGGSASFTPGSGVAEVTISTDGGLALIYDLKTGNISVSDPNQSLQSVRVEMRSGSADTQTLDFELPQGGLAGDTVTINVQS
ncbi:hypothetical protein AX16_004493 [Volvariella volvacea WC 439]|nr:hypothetical protein AX16_004493 [Volvariella volvacea WC 439]